MKPLLLILLTGFALAHAHAAAPTRTEVVAAVLIAEAGGQGVTAMRAVIQVRAATQRRTELAIVTAPKQFSCLNRTTPSRLVTQARKHPRWSEALCLASVTLRRATVSHANHYHALTVSPTWAKGTQPVAIIGGHAFYKL